MPALTAVVTKNWIFFIFGDLFIIPCPLGYHVIDNVSLGVRHPRDTIFTVHDIVTYTDAYYRGLRETYRQRFSTALYSEVRELYQPGVYHLDCNTIPLAGDMYKCLAGVLY